MRELSYLEFYNIVKNRAGNRTLKTKIWSNYPNSIFVYFADEMDTDIMDKEIAIYTNRFAWAIFI